MLGHPSRLLRELAAATLLFTATATCWAADFGLSATIRAGSTSSADWELAIGPTGNSAANNASLQPYYPDAQPRRFELGYTNATNTAFLRYYQTATAFQQATFAPGGPGLGANSLWTIPVGSLFVAATPRLWATSITVDQLALGGGVQVLQGLSTTTLTATRTLANVQTNLPGPLVFRTNAGGNWLLSGRVSFTALSAYTFLGTLFGAQGSNLQFSANATGTRTTPEPPVSALLASGLIFIGLRARRRRTAGGSR